MALSFPFLRARLAITAVCLWVLASYVYDCFRIGPKLLLTSPEKRCGKTTALSVLRALCCKALVASNITPAAVFRVIDKWKPTLLIDEADTFLGQNDELRGVINSGHTKDAAFVVRTVGDAHEPTKFSTWTPMALAMIKTPADTIVDRSVVIRLRRKLSGEKVERVPLDLPARQLNLRRKLLAWADDAGDRLTVADPDMPKTGNDRALDNWTPLLAIADEIGEPWPDKARTAFTAMVGNLDDEAVGPMLLADIRLIFEDTNRMRSGDLVDRLVELEGRPWSEWKRGRPMTQNSWPDC